MRWVAVMDLCRWRTEEGQRDSGRKMKTINELHPTGTSGRRSGRSQCSGEIHIRCPVGP